jgi:hypothetical protein
MMIGSDFAKEQDRIKTILKEMADKAKTTGEEAELIKKSVMYPASGTSTYVPMKETSKRGGGLLPGAALPAGFEHYSHCICF